MYEYAKLQKLTYSKIYHDLLNDLLESWNVSMVTNNFYDIRAKYVEDTSNTTIEIASNDEWNFFHAIRILLAIDQKFDWFPNKIGNFLVAWLFVYLNGIRRQPFL